MEIMQMSTQNVKAAIIDENGGSEKFKIITQEVGSPGSDEILIQHKACLLYTSTSPRD